MNVGRRQAFQTDATPVDYDEDDAVNDQRQTADR